MIQEKIVYQSTATGEYFDSLEEAVKAEQKTTSKEKMEQKDSAKELLEKFRQIRKAYQIRLSSIQRAYEKVEHEELNIHNIYDTALSELAEKLHKMGIDVSELEESEDEKPAAKTVKVRVMRKKNISWGE